MQAHAHAKRGLKPDPLEEPLLEAKMVSRTVAPFSFHPYNDEKRPDEVDRQTDRQTDKLDSVTVASRYCLRILTKSKTLTLTEIQVSPRPAKAR